jgi:hypothetical protein
VSLPAPPSLLSINVSAFGGVNIPTLDVTIPELTIDAPSVREYVPGAQYTSSLLTRSRRSCRTLSTNGGTGLCTRRRERDLGPRPRA